VSEACNVTFRISAERKTGWRRIRFVLGLVFFHYVSVMFQLVSTRIKETRVFVSPPRSIKFKYRTSKSRITVYFRYNILYNITKEFVRLIVFRDTEIGSIIMRHTRFVWIVLRIKRTEDRLHNFELPQCSN